MYKNDFKEMIIKSMHKENKAHIQLPERNQILMYLHGTMLTTGRIDIMYCNAFLDEAIQLLTNSIFLYEDGLFDCAFYSIRQAGEVINSMLFFSESDRDALKRWSAKKYFPVDSKLKSQLEKISDAYKEIKSLIPEYFEHHSELIRKSHKIIHKQGFDTFYRLRNQISDKYEFSQDDETKLFTDSLKYTLGIILIVFIILDPLSLALSDEEVTLKLNFNLITEPIDVNYFYKYLNLNDVIDKIKNSQFYKDFIAGFADNEPMSPAVYSVIREEAWNIDALDEIEKQLALLNSYERFMFCILKLGIRISRFYFNGGLSWYFTSIESNFDRHAYGGEEFEKYLEPDNRFNQLSNNVYITVIVMYDDPLFLEHNAPLTFDEIQALKTLEAQGIQELEKFNKEISKSQQEE